MKTKLNLFSIFAIVLASLLLYACQKDLSLSPEPAAQEGILLDDEGVLAKAKEWYRNNMERVSKPSDIDVRLLSPDWDSYVLSENRAGQPWISVPLQNQANADTYLTELSMVIDQKGRANGIIKEFRDNPYIGDSELTIYLGNGKVYEKGTYKHKRNSLVVNRTGGYYRGKDKLHRIAYGHKASGERKTLNFLKSSGGSGGEGFEWELEIEEVEIPPPGGGGNPNDPWDPWEGWEWPDGGGGDDQGGDNPGGGGGGHCNHCGGGDGGNAPINPPPPPAVVAPVVTINLQQRLNCFNSVPSNGANYKITLHAHKGVGGGNKPGHAYITLEKSNGSNTQRLSYGFYPVSSLWSVTMQPVPSAIGEESGDYQRKSDSRYSWPSLLPNFRLRSVHR